jgi:hypothetical protein
MGDAPALSPSDRAVVADVLAAVDSGSRRCAGYLALFLNELGNELARELNVTEKDAEFWRIVGALA